MKDKRYPLCRKSIEDKEKYFFTRNKHYSKSIRITFTAGLADTASLEVNVLHFFIYFNHCTELTNYIILSLGIHKVFNNMLIRKSDKYENKPYKFKSYR